VRADNQSLFYVSRFGRAGYKYAEPVPVHLPNLPVRVVHGVYYLVFVQQDHQIFGYEVNDFLPDMLGYPNASVLGNTDLSFNDGQMKMA
jgi:hypothetical protein